MVRPPLKFRDRFYTRRVAQAMTSPSGILLAGVGVAAGVLLGPLWLGPILGALAWSGRVAAAIPRGFDADGVDPFELDEPWRGYVWRAKRARRHYTDAIKAAKDGPLRDRLHEIGDRITVGIEQCWQVAQSGQTITAARARIDVASITQQLTELNPQATANLDPASPLRQTVESLESQLATAKRMDAVLADTNERLRLLDARLDESVTKAIELSVRAQSADDLQALTDDVDSVVGELESLREALGETDATTGSRLSSRPGPASAAQAAQQPGQQPAMSVVPPAVPLPPAPPPDPLLQRTDPAVVPQPSRPSPQAGAQEPQRQEPRHEPGPG